MLPIGWPLENSFKTVISAHSHRLSQCACLCVCVSVVISLILNAILNFNDANIFAQA